MPQLAISLGHKSPLRHLALAYSLMSLTLASCSSFTGSSAQATTSQPLMSYGIEGSITRSELATLKGLAWPQQYQDMVGTFGFPYYRSATADYYQVKGSSDWVVIYYSDHSATGFSFDNPPITGGEL